jgi:hypothetical protein
MAILTAAWDIDANIFRLLVLEQKYDLHHHTSSISDFAHTAKFIRGASDVWRRVLI